MFGYTFDINPAAAIEICREKAATSLVLESHGVPNIPHKVFLSPTSPMTRDYVPRAGIWQGIQACVEEWGLPIVLKSLKGTGGINVYKATCMREVEAAVHQIHSAEYGLAVSPYKRIIDEYRCVLLDGVPELIYRKVRSTVRGDGERTVGALIAEQLSAAEPKDMPDLLRASSELAPELLGRIPEGGEEVAVQWKHNLGTGAKADTEVSAKMKEDIGAIARRAAAAIGVRFCSVDVVSIQEDEAEVLMIMEVNGGVMMDSIMGQLDDGVDVASRVYETAVLRALGRA